MKRSLIGVNLGFWLATLGVLGVSSVFAEAPSISTGSGISHGGKFTATASAMALCRVLPALNLVLDPRLMGLDDTFPGAGPQIIGPTDSRAGGFNMSGSRDDAVSIIMPSEIRLSLGSEDSEDSTIVIERIQTTLESSNAIVSAIGLAIGIGATRPAIPLTQRIGRYTGNFDIQVIHP